MRLIDADIIDMEEMDFHTAQTRAMACEAAQDVVDAQPTVDAEPVRHAHWIEVNYGTIAQCSNCFDLFDVTDTESIKTAHEAFENYCIFYKYCPCCGVKMDEKVEK